MKFLENLTVPKKLFELKKGFAHLELFKKPHGGHFAIFYFRSSQKMWETRKNSFSYISIF